MRRRLASLAVLLFAAVFAIAQSIAPASLLYTYAQAGASTSTGQLGNYLVFDGVKAPRPGNYTIDWTVTGTPGACTFNAQGSADGTNWYSVDGGSPVSCTASGAEQVSAKPVLYLRINLVAWTPSGATATFHYTGGRS